ncbi:hypothetical protein ESCO_005080 [Escovopsis weberi]|uniref:Uncharacterized protein n=1 Tax=Escovopsis weberi TaxID=150374 RepID=A0A0M8MY13_ESCWE|nr:hypothetical protein ESCO_005080 [Escovopsis weberi]
MLPSLTRKPRMLLAIVNYHFKPFAISDESLPDCLMASLSLQPSRSQPSPEPYREDDATTDNLRRTLSPVSMRSGRSRSSHRGYITPPTSAGPSSPSQPAKHRPAALSSASASSSSSSPSPFPRISQAPHDHLTPPDSPIYGLSGRRRSPSGCSAAPGGFLHPDDIPRRRPRGLSDVDTIDSLDTVGGTYHHSGPFDAASMSRNPHWESSPLAAVHDSNMEALRATPAEYIVDALEHGAPLQGTAIIPPGSRDWKGKKVAYAEGDDLMRDPDAPGGPYRRYDEVSYHPADLKGKGEPSFSREERLKDIRRRKGYTFISSPLIDDDPCSSSRRWEPRVHEIPLDFDPSKHSFSEGAEERDFFIVQRPPRHPTNDGGRPSTGWSISESFKRRLESFREGKNRLFSRRGRTEGDDIVD